MSAQGPVRVVVADDHPSVRENLRYLIDAEPDLMVVDVAKDGRQCVEVCKATRPDVLVLDERMPFLDGLEVAARLRIEAPSVRIVMYALDDDVRVLSDAYDIVAYVTKDEPPGDLLAAIRSAAGRTAAPR